MQIHESAEDYLEAILMLRAALENSGLASDVQAAMDRLLTREYGYCMTK